MATTNNKWDTVMHPTRRAHCTQGTCTSQKKATWMEWHSGNDERTSGCSRMLTSRRADAAKWLSVKSEMKVFRLPGAGKCQGGQEWESMSESYTVSPEDCVTDWQGNLGTGVWVGGMHQEIRGCCNASGCGSRGVWGHLVDKWEMNFRVDMQWETEAADKGQQEPELWRFEPHVSGNVLNICCNFNQNLHKLHLCHNTRCQGWMKYKTLNSESHLWSALKTYISVQNWIFFCS